MSHKKVLEALNELSVAYRTVAQEEMSKGHGCVYEVYYAMRDSIAAENKSRIYSRRHGSAIDDEMRY